MVDNTWQRYELQPCFIVSSPRTPYKRPYRLGYCLRTVYVDSYTRLVLLGITALVQLCLGVPCLSIWQSILGNIPGNLCGAAMLLFLATPLADMAETERRAHSRTHALLALITTGIRSSTSSIGLYSPTGYLSPDIFPIRASNFSSRAYTGLPGFFFCMTCKGTEKHNTSIGHGGRMFLLV